jgi:hypothetical protein
MATSDLYVWEAGPRGRSAVWLADRAHTIDTGDTVVVNGYTIF